jgi:hypothetical protein
MVEAIPAKKVVWLVLDNYLKFVQDQSEWKGTKLCFEISRKASKTEVRFTHIGLVPQAECFDACSSAWSFYANDSLRALITTGKGKPDQTVKG